LRAAGSPAEFGTRRRQAGQQCQRPGFPGLAQPAHGIAEAVEHQPQEDADLQHRRIDLALGLQQIMYQGDHGDEVDNAMQPAPGLAAHAADRRVEGGDAERDQPKHSNKTNREIEAQYDLGGDAHQIELEVGDIDAEMQQCIGHGGNADLAPQLDQRRPIEQPAQRRDAERTEQQPYRPAAGFMGQFVDRARPQVIQRQPRRQPQAGQPEQHKAGRLQRRQATIAFLPGKSHGRENRKRAAPRQAPSLSRWRELFRPEAARHDLAAGHQGLAPGGGAALHRHLGDAALAQGEGGLAIAEILVFAARTAERRVIPVGTAVHRGIGRAFTEVAQQVDAVFTIACSRFAGAGKQLLLGQADKFLLAAQGQFFLAGRTAGEYH